MVNNANKLYLVCSLSFYYICRSIEHDSSALTSEIKGISSTVSLFSIVHFSITYQYCVLFNNETCLFMLF